MQVDYIIIGQGLVGSAVALQLLKRNKKILNLDSSEVPATAAGAAVGRTVAEVAKLQKRLNSCEFSHDRLEVPTWN